MRWHAYPDSETAAAACAQFIVARLEEALSGKEQATLALSGGSTPKPMFTTLAGLRFPWERVHVFWVDERAVPPDSPQSNYRLAAETFLTPAGVPQGNIHRILAELAPEEAARRYEQTVRDFFGLKPGELPHFDVIHRGMGADAHTASLFPGEPLIGDRQGIAAAVYAQRLGQWRITLLPGVLESARNTVMLVTGADKAEVLRAVFQEPYAPERYPAQLGSRGGAMTWFLDEGVARLIAGG